VIEFDPAGAVFAVMGLVMLAAALLPSLLSRAPLSMPMVFLAAGFLGWTLIPQLPDPDPVGNGDLALPLTEVTVIVALMGAGLALNRPFGWSTWSSTWRLLAITMPLSMLAAGFLGWAALGLGVAGALLVAAALAPTDPVLASEVQVGEPDEDPEADDEARFALTSEAGLNDGLAFPFTLAAIAMSRLGADPSEWFTRWLLVDVGWRVGVGLLVGLVVGRLLGRLFFAPRTRRLRLADRAEGFVALAATFLAYGAAELAEGYGFIAVFVCACTIRAVERQHGYHVVLHSFVGQTERLLTVAVLVLLGGAVARGILAGIGWVDVAVALVFLLIIRPVAGWIGLTPGKTGPWERAAIAFFGVRGVGSLFYVAYAMQNGVFPQQTHLWAIVALVVVGSIIIHGVTAAPAMILLDRARRHETRRQGGDESDIATTPV
jgi:sodium/hydrogen antiporter